jgi:uroporphyrinogen-III synthase
MRILVLRPGTDAERTARAVAARGHTPIVAPLFDIVRLPAEPPRGTFSALILTSANAVPALADAPAAWRDLPLFSVGARTAGRARAAGFADARSADGDRHALIELIRDNLPAPARLLLVAGRDSHEDVPAILTAAGYEVSLWTAYAAQAVGTLPEIAACALRDHEADAALHFSARGADTFLALARAAGLEAQARALTHAALSAEVAAPLIAAGASTVLVAEYPEEAALLAALDEVSARNRRGEGDREKVIAPADGDTDADEMSDTDDKPTPRARSRRTPPTIEVVARETAAPEAAASEPPAPEPELPAAATAAAPEAILPTEALPREYPSADSQPALGGAAETHPVDEPDHAPAAENRRLPVMALGLAGLAGGVIGAGLMLALTPAPAPTVSPSQLAELRRRVDTLQTAATTLDQRAGAATDVAAKAATDAQAALARANQIATARQAQAPEPGVIAGLSEQASRAETATTALGERLDQTAARIGDIETLAKSAAAPSPQALAAARIVLAERVHGAIASGQPFATDVAALAKGGGAPEQIAALNAVAASGAATRDALLAQFRTHRPMFAREMTPVAGSWQDRVLGLASRIVTIRPVGESGDNDPGTLLIRLENAIAGGNIIAASGLWGQLPEPARRDSSDFGAALQKRAAAEAAIARIAQDAVAALGTAG